MFENDINVALPVAVVDGGLGLASPPANGILIGNGVDQVNSLMLTDGQLMVGVTGSAPLATTLTAGTDIGITNASGQVTISTNQSGWIWTEIADASFEMVANNGYITTGETGCNYSLPAVLVEGDEFKIVQNTPDGGDFVVNFLDGQTVIFGSQTQTGDGLGSEFNGSTLDFVCVDTTTPGSETFIVLNYTGGITFG